MNFLLRILSALQRIICFFFGAVLILCAVLVLTENQILPSIFMGCFGLACLGKAVNSDRLLNFYSCFRLVIFFIAFISFVAFLIDAAFGTSLHESFKIFIQQL